MMKNVKQIIQFLKQKMLGIIDYNFFFKVSIIGGFNNAEPNLNGKQQQPSLALAA